MQEALKLAAKSKDKTYPNPMVGAVIVKGGKIIGKGYHKKAGEDHAEVAAIKNAAGTSRGGTMYVSLEPCNHYGKTPPCTQAIIESGIKTVYAAMRDPNPVTSGQGARKLRKAGIRVNLGLCKDAALILNEKYIKSITKGLPYITIKLAQSIDGKIAARDRTSKWISSAESRKLVKKMRADFDAVMVGSGTLLADDPRLRGVTRVIVDSRLRIPISSNVIKTAKKSRVIIGTTELAPRSRLQSISHLEGVEVVTTKSKDKKVSLRSFMRQLVKRGIVNLLVEGGGELVGSLIDASLVDEAIFFIAPKIIGGSFTSIKGRGVKNIIDAIELRDVEVKSSGRDILVRGRVK